VTLPGIASATPILYGVTFGNQLITINPTTGAGTLVGNLSSNMAAFGLGTFGGKLYAFDQVADLLREIDPSTAATVSSINLGVGNLTGEGGLDFRSDGVGFLNSTSGTTSNVYRFTLAANSGVLVGSENTAGIDGLAFSPTDVLYAMGQQPQNNLYTVNQTTGALTLVGATGFSNASSLSGLDFIGGTLYGVISDSLYTLNPLTGAATLVGPTGFSSISGLASLDVGGTATVPEPATLLLLGSGAIALSRRRMRRG